MTGNVDMMEIINDLAYPRLSGSENDEVKCRDYLIGKFKGLGVEPVIEPVPWSPFATTVLLRLIVGMILAGLVLAILFDYLGWTLVNLIFILTLIACIVIAVSMQQSYIDAFATMGRTRQTYNIYCKLAAASGKATKDIIFMAHHDTKSQKVVTLVRTVAYVLAFALSIGLGLMLVIVSILRVAGVAGDWSTMRLIALVILAADLPFIFILLYNTTIEGKSVGALDNSTGIAIVFKLLEHFKEKGPLPNANLWFIITGAEEYGMCGAIEFWRKHHAETGELRPETTYVLNFDMVAQGLAFMEYFGFGKAPYNEKLNDLIKKHAGELGIDVHGFWLPMLGTTDGWIFKVHGCETADIINEKTARYSHSGKDTPERCDEKTLEEAVEISKRVVEDLAD